MLNLANLYLKAGGVSGHPTHIATYINDAGPFGRRWQTSESVALISLLNPSDPFLTLL